MTGVTLRANSAPLCWPTTQAGSVARRIPGAARLVRRQADSPTAVKAAAKKRTAKKAAANDNWPGREVRTTVYVESRPKGRQKGSAIGLCRRGARDRVLKTFKTPAEAIPWAKSEGTSPHVARPASER
jgi:hypothetical protein